MEVEMGGRPKNATKLDDTVYRSISEVIEEFFPEDEVEEHIQPARWTWERPGATPDAGLLGRPR